MKNNIFGYIRVSTPEQNTDRQHLALKPFKIPPKNLYIDRQSGKDFDRPAYRALLRRLNAGDLLIIKAIDRLGRNYEDIIEQWRLITREKGADIKVLDMPVLDTGYRKDLLGTFISDLVLQLLSFVAQTERDFIRQRQSEGITAAKARGVVFGKTPIAPPENFPELFQSWRSGKYSASETAALCGFSRATLYNKTQHLRIDK